MPTLPWLAGIGPLGNLFSSYRLFAGHKAAPNLTAQMARVSPKWAINRVGGLETAILVGELSAVRSWSKHAVYVPDPKYERVSSVVNDFGNATCIRTNNRKRVYHCFANRRRATALEARRKYKKIRGAEQAGDIGAITKETDVPLEVLLLNLLFKGLPLISISCPNKDDVWELIDDPWHDLQ